jgi:hypothetical protein
MNFTAKLKIREGTRRLSAVRVDAFAPPHGHDLTYSMIICRKGIVQ